MIFDCWKCKKGSLELYFKPSTTEFNKMRKIRICDICGFAYDDETNEILNDNKENQYEYSNTPTVNPYEWISVEDRLPEKHTDVLCYYKFEPDSPDIICENTYQGSGHWVSEGDRVTHWMPLPPPPTEKE